MGSPPSGAEGFQLFVLRLFHGKDSLTETKDTGSR